MDDKEYRESIIKLENLCQMAISLSNATFGRSVPSWREQIGSIIFGKICLTSIAILKLLPQSKFYTPTNSTIIWDVSSVCALSRALIDNFNVFHYLIIDQIDEKELEFRYTLWKLHSESERLRMLELIKSKSPMDAIKKNIDDLKAEVKGNSFYQSLSEKQKVKYLSGKEGIFLKGGQISERAGINPDYYKAAFKYLSNYTHTYAFSISQIALFRAGDSGTLSVLNAVLGYCTVYLSFAINCYTKIFPDVRSSLPHEIVEMINNSERDAEFSEN